MNSLDYIIVGLGLSGIAFAEQLEQNRKTYVVFEDYSQSSSRVASGIYNPVVLRRFTPIWNAKEHLNSSISFFKALEQKLKNSYVYPLPIARIFKSIEEQNNWIIACDNPVLKYYMEPKIYNHSLKGIKSPFGYGRLKNTGRVDLKSLLIDYEFYLKTKSILHLKSFKYKDLKLINNQFIRYQNYTAKHIVFCQGYGNINNPYFNDLPIIGSKGELVTIEVKDLDLNFLLKGPVSIIPIGSGLYRVGSTFQWEDKSLGITKRSRVELENKIQTLLEVPYRVIEQDAGTRPTTKDRRPLIGTHPKHSQLHLLNGLGTRGIILAPIMSKLLFEHIENNKKIPKEISLSRFYKNNLT